MHSDLDQRRQAVAQRLRDLPDEVAQPYDWAEFQRRARARRDAGAGGGSSDHAGTKRNLAMAAVVLALLIVIAGSTRFGAPHEAPGDGVLAEDDPTTWTSMDPYANAMVTSSPDGELTIRFTTSDQHAGAVETWLATLPKEPVVVRVGTRAAVAGLEDRIAQLDDILSAERVEGVQPARLVVLQEQRERLVSSLAQVRYAETLSAQAR